MNIFLSRIKESNTDTSIMYAIEVVKSSSDNDLTPGFAAIMCLWGTDMQYLFACAAYMCTLCIKLQFSYVCFKCMCEIRCIYYDNKIKN